MSRHPIKVLPTRDRLELRKDALGRSVETIQALINEHGNKALDLPPNTPEHEYSSQMAEILTIAIEEAHTRLNTAYIKIFCYDKGREDERSLHG